jgi:predicted Zn-dependent protease
MKPRFHVALAATFALALFAGCATNPVTGKKELSLVSESQEIAAGQQSKQATAIEYGYYEEGGWASKVDSVGKALARRSHRPDLPWEFHVLDDPTVNAFCAPGGFIYITRGILAHLNSEAQLAGVMGHEEGHATARHYARAASRQTLFGIGLAAGSIFSSSVARASNVVQAGLGVLFLKYSRDQENESDQLGVTYSVASGWDAREMPATYRTLARIGEAAGARTPTYLSTHPDPAAREATVRQLAAAATAGKTGLIVRRDEYIRALDGMVYGNDPRQGYFEGDRYYHPELRFQFDVPSGWQKQNGHTAILAASPNQSAVMQVTTVDLKGQSPTQFVQSLVNQRQVTGADGRAETIGGMEAWVGRLGVTDEQGQQGILDAAFIRQSGTQAFQILGQAKSGSSDENAIFASARSFRPLTDSSRFNPSPARIDIVPAPRAGLFGQVVASLGDQGIEASETAILNGLDADESVVKGQLLKVVRPARLR